MKRKNIKACLRNVLRRWTDTIDDPAVVEAINQNAFVTGGAIASMLLKEEVKDYDVYFRTRESCLLVARYYVERFKKNPPPKFGTHAGEVAIWVDDSRDDRISIMVKSAGVAGEVPNNSYAYFEANPNAQGDAAAEYLERAKPVSDDDAEQGENNDTKKPKYRPVYLSANAITLSHGIQIVTRFYGEPDEVHKNYDFVHCTNYWCAWSGWLELRPQALEALLSKELIYVGSKYPLCSIMRIRKFLDRGYFITAGQLLKMCWQVNQLDLSDVDILEEQLTGVDTAYFVELVKKLRDADTTKVDGAYLFQLVDEVF